MTGGDEGPCQSESLLRVIEEETGHPCPRRESYNADDSACLELLMLAATPALSTLFEPMKEELLVDVDPDTRVRLLRRVLAAFGDERTAPLLPKRFI